MMRRLRIYATLAAIAGLSACAVPMVAYERVEVANADDDRKAVKPDLEGRPKFKLASSMIMLKSETKDEQPTTLRISSIPVEEARNITYAIVDASVPGIKANLKVKHRDNSMLLESVTTALEDNRLKLIQGIGGVVGAVVGLQIGLDAKLPASFSATIDLRAYLNDAGREKPGRFSLDDKTLGEYKRDASHTFVVKTLTVGPIPADATPRDIYPTKSIQRALIYSACRDVSLTISIDNMDYAGSLRIADPNYVQTIALPQKGSITMHSECGVTVASEPVQTTSPTDLLQEIIKQIKGVAGK